MKWDKPLCRKCSSSDSLKLRRQIAASGATQIFWYCVKCKCNANSSFIKKTYVEAQANGRFGIDDIPLFVDYRLEGEPCAVCGSLGAEYHHWLPQCFSHLVDDFSAWPGIYLCKPCHRRWHNIVTPYLPGFGSTPEAQYTIEKYIIPFMEAIHD